MTSAVTVLPRRWDVATWKEFDKTTKYQGEHFSNRYKVDLTDLCLVPNDGTVGLHSQKLNLSRASQQDSAWFCYFNTVIYFNPEQYSWNFPKHDSILLHAMFYLKPWGNYILKWCVVNITQTQFFHSVSSQRHFSWIIINPHYLHFCMCRFWWHGMTPVVSSLATKCT